MVVRAMVVRLGRFGWLPASGLVAAFGFWMAEARLLAAEPSPTPAAAEAVEPAEGKLLPPLPPDGPGGPRMRHRAGDRFDGPGPWMWRQLSPEERAEIRQFLAETFPERFADIREAEENGDEFAGRYIGRMLPELIRLRELRDRDPEAFELRVTEMKREFALRRVARRYQSTDDPDLRAELEGEIRALVAELFDLRVQSEKLELARLEQRLEPLRARIARREAERDENIEGMVADILSGKRPIRDAEGGEGFRAVPEGRGRERGADRPGRGGRQGRGPRSSPEPEEE